MLPGFPKITYFISPSAILTLPFISPVIFCFLSTHQATATAILFLVHQLLPIYGESLTRALPTFSFVVFLWSFFPSHSKILLFSSLGFLLHFFLFRFVAGVTHKFTKFYERCTLGRKRFITRWGYMSKKLPQQIMTPFHWYPLTRIRRDIPSVWTRFTL